MHCTWAGFRWVSWNRVSDFSGAGDPICSVCQCEFMQRANLPCWQAQDSIVGRATSNSAAYLRCTLLRTLQCSRAAFTEVELAWPFVQMCNYQMITSMRLVVILFSTFHMRSHWLVRSSHFSKQSAFIFAPSMEGTLDDDLRQDVGLRCFHGDGIRSSVFLIKKEHSLLRLGGKRGRGEGGSGSSVYSRTGTGTTEERLRLTDSLGSFVSLKVLGFLKSLFLSDKETLESLQVPQRDKRRTLTVFLFKSVIFDRNWSINTNKGQNQRSVRGERRWRRERGRVSSGTETPCESLTGELEKVRVIIYPVSVVRKCDVEKSPSASRYYEIFISLLVEHS